MADATGFDAEVADEVDRLTDAGGDRARGPANGCRDDPASASSRRVTWWT
jgi:hypothetical protein